MTDNPQTPAQDGKSFEFAALLEIIRERWWLVPLCFILSLGLGVLYIFVTPKSYLSQTMVEVEQSATKVLNVQDLISEDLKQDQVLKTIEQNLVNGEVLQAVIAQLKLTPRDLGLPARPDGGYLEGELSDALRKMVSAKLKRGTRLIIVGAQSTDPKMAQSISGTLVAKYIQLNLDQRVGIASQASDYLSEEAIRAKARIDLAEEAAQEYKNAHPGVPLDDTAQFIGDKMLVLINKVNDARQTRIRLEADNAQVQKILAEGDRAEQANKLLGVQSLANDPNVLQLQKGLTEATAEFESLKRRYLPAHPIFKRERTKLDRLEASLNAAAIQAALGLGTALDAAREAEDKFQQLLKDERKEKEENDSLTIPYDSLIRMVQQSREFYDSIRQRLRETDATASINDNRIRIVSPADLPYKANKPKRALVLAATGLLGLLLGLAACAALAFADQSLRTVDQTEELLDLPALGAIPVRAKTRQGDQMLISSEPDEILAESFRTLRATLCMLSGEKAGASFLFTSSIPSEGKTFCSANFAISLAQLGRKTLLVDADLRLPALEPLFFKDRKPNGLGTLLTGGASVAECYFPTPVANLFLMPSEKRLENPAETLANSDFPALVAQMLAEFDAIVFDTAPVHAVSDTLLICKHVDAVCLVVRAAKTPARAVSQAAQKLLKANAPLIGFAMNCLRLNKSAYYYSYTDDYLKGSHRKAHATA